MHAICYDASNPVAVRYVVVTPEGRARRDIEIPVEHGPMIHDCALTQRFAIIFDLPVTFSMEAALAGFSFPYRWNASHKARIGLLPREGNADDVIWCPLDPCYVFHAINAYDTPDGKVIADVVVHDKMFWRTHAGPDAQKTSLERWTIDPKTRSVARTVLDPAAQEFPRCDPRRYSLPYRYAYTMQLVAPFLGVGLYKHDLKTGTRQSHGFASRTTSERTVTLANSCSCPRMPMPRRMKAGSSASSSTQRQRRRTSSSSTRKTSKPRRERASACRTSSRRASTATGYPTSNGVIVQPKESTNDQTCSVHRHQRSRDRPAQPQDRLFLCRGCSSV
jgi:hypothetical protein